MVDTLARSATVTDISMDPASEPSARRRILVRRRLSRRGQRKRWLVRASRRGYLRIFVVSAGALLLMALGIFLALSPHL